MPRPKPLFSSVGSVFRRRQPPVNSDNADAAGLAGGYASDGQSTDSEDEDYVERSLPPSPADAYFASASSRGFSGLTTGSSQVNEAGPSRAMRFAWEDEAVMRYAAGAFDEGSSPHTREEGEGVREGERGDPLYEAGAQRAGASHVEQPGPGHEGLVEVKPDMYDSDDELRPVRPEDEHEHEHNAQLGAMYADDGGMRYRAGRSRAEDARRTLEAQIVQEALDDAAQDEEEEEEEIPAPDERQCRICFGGREEEETMGRLISPCLCTGSMRVRVSI